MNARFRSPLAISIVLHLLLFVAALGPLTALLPKLAPRIRPPDLVEVRLAPKIGEAAPRAAARPRVVAPLPRLSQLGVKLFEPRPVLPGTPETSKSAASDSVSDARPRAGSPDFGSESAANPFHSYVYQRIDAGLTYPVELYTNGIEGDVHVRLSFTDKGELDSDSVQYESSSPYLKVAVARAIRAAFRDPVPVEKLTGKAPFKVDCLFRFQVTEHNDEGLKQTFRLSIANELAFYRNFQHSKLQWDLGPLHGVGPFALGIDVMWFPKAISDLFSNKAKIDPLDSYRDDPLF